MTRHGEVGQPGQGAGPGAGPSVTASEGPAQHTTSPGRPASSPREKTLCVLSCRVCGAAPENTHPCPPPPERPERTCLLAPLLGPRSVRRANRDRCLIIKRCKYKCHLTRQNENEVLGESFMENVCFPEKRNLCPSPVLYFLLAVKRAGGRLGSHLSSMR